jgi:hypothetical protein
MENYLTGRNAWPQNWRIASSGASCTLVEDRDFRSAWSNFAFFPNIFMDAPPEEFQPKGWTS